MAKFNETLREIFKRAGVDISDYLGAGDNPYAKYADDKLKKLFAEYTAEAMRLLTVDPAKGREFNDAAKLVKAVLDERKANK